jgi:hypothetical protein
MRFVLFCILGMFLWAGTVSIKFPRQSSTVTASSGPTCLGIPDGERLMEYLTKGTITSILDNGRILTIGLSPEWTNFPPSVQQKTYDTVACYAQSQHRPFQFIVTH